jgi:hypothetical protein
LNLSLDHLDRKNVKINIKLCCSELNVGAKVIFFITTRRKKELKEVWVATTPEKSAFHSQNPALFKPRSEISREHEIKWSMAAYFNRIQI